MGFAGITLFLLFVIARIAAKAVGCGDIFDKEAKYGKREKRQRTKTDDLVSLQEHWRVARETLSFEVSVFVYFFPSENAH